MGETRLERGQREGTSRDVYHSLQSIHTDIFFISNREDKQNISVIGINRWTRGKSTQTEEVLWGRRVRRQEIVCVPCWLHGLHAGRERVATRLGCEARKTRRGRYNTACFFPLFCRALAPSKCLSHANKACLKLIELTEAASETKMGKRGKRGEKGVRTREKENSLQPSFFF